jgi:hypothetical protein
VKRDPRIQLEDRKRPTLKSELSPAKLGEALADLRKRELAERRAFGSWYRNLEANVY